MNRLAVCPTGTKHAALSERRLIDGKLMLGNHESLDIKTLVCYISSRKIEFKEVIRYGREQFTREGFLP